MWEPYPHLMGKYKPIMSVTEIVIWKGIDFFALMSPKIVHYNHDFICKLEYPPACDSDMYVNMDLNRSDKMENRKQCSFNSSHKEQWVYGK